MIDKDGKLLPSALIPFCDFGGRTSLVASDELDQFEVPICTCFKEKIFNDRHCYSVDLNEFYHKDNIENELKLGFAFTMDYNEDHQVITNEDDQKTIEDGFGLVRSTIEADQDEHAFIYLNTIGKLFVHVNNEIILIYIQIIYNNTCNIMIYG